MAAKDIESKINELPEDLKREVIDFIDFLIMKKKQGKQPGGFTFRCDAESGPCFLVQLFIQQITRSQKELQSGF